MPPPPSANFELQKVNESIISEWEAYECFFNMVTRICFNPCKCSVNTSHRITQLPGPLKISEL